MNPIRPNLPPAFSPNVVSPNAAPKASEAARTAAQKAFFELALGKTPAAAPVQAVARPAPMRAAAPLQRVTQAPAEAPSRPLRPGSILDIRV